VSQSSFKNNTDTCSHPTYYIGDKRNITILVLVHILLLRTDKVSSGQDQKGAHPIASGKSHEREVDKKKSKHGLGIIGCARAPRQHGRVVLTQQQSSNMLHKQDCTCTTTKDRQRPLSRHHDVDKVKRGHSQSHEVDKINRVIKYSERNMPCICTWREV
jgi:hypothetical protein